MEIKRIGENKIRCALTEAEIQDLGFDIDEIIGNNEMTQKFMRAILSIVEEKENISLDSVSPMVKAELLQDHSMAITFGGESDLTFKSLVDTVNHLVSQMEQGSLKDKQAVVEEFLKNLKPDKNTQNAVQSAAEDAAQDAVQPEVPGGKENGNERFGESMVCALRFAALEDLIAMSHVCFPGKVPESSLYKAKGSYFLILDFSGFDKTEMRPFAFGTVEYDDGHFSEPGQIAFIREQGNCIVRNHALQMLMEL